MRRLKTTWMWLAGLALLMLTGGRLGRRGEDEFDPSLEFQLDPYVNLDLGFIDMSINKAVVYLFISSVIVIGLGLYVMRKGDLREARAARRTSSRWPTSSARPRSPARRCRQRCSTGTSRTSRRCSCSSRSTT